MSLGWIGFDFDGTLATYNKGDYHRYGAYYFGAPIENTVRLAQQYLRDGFDVKVVTARVEFPVADPAMVEAIQLWCEEHIGVRLPVQCHKDYNLLCLYDDRAVAVETNTGKILGGGR